MTIFEITLFGITIAPSYYWLMYALGFLYWVWYLKKYSSYTPAQQESLFLYAFLGTIIGWRLWYVLFYNLESYLRTPLDILRIWDGWMSFHGGFLWVVIAVLIFSLRNKIRFWNLADTIAMIIPVGLFFGRIGNYINKELLGFEYVGPLAVVTSSWSYFPSPLVQAAGEWLLIFVLFHYILKKPRFSGQFAALFLIIYSLVRIFVELFVRTPDTQIGYYYWFITQWSLLSFPMLAAGLFLYYYLSQKNYASK